MPNETEKPTGKAQPVKRVPLPVFELDSYEPVAAFQQKNGSYKQQG